MKRVMTFFIIAFAMVYCLQAAQVAEPVARQVAEKFFSEKSSHFMAHPGQSQIRLVFTADRHRFYVYDRGSSGGFVIVAGNDRLPQVLGYGAEGDFSSTALPPAVQYWMESLDRQISFLQSHGDVAVHHPSHRASAVGPLLTSHWNQTEPFNNYCPTYGAGTRAVTGCVATATAQIMNYYQWPPVGRGSHSYLCYMNSNYAEPPLELSADFSQSVYRWDLMLDDYDESSSEESCDAVARLMSDVGISMDMNYGSSSGASQYDASQALQRYFGYGNKCYWLSRDHCSAAEWEQFLVDELSLRRPIMYVGNTVSSGHAFVLDGFDSDGYFHFNWGWGGRYDGYFLVSVLNPSVYDFKYDQTGLFGLVPETQVDSISDFMTIHGRFYLDDQSVPLGTRAELSMECISEGNMRLDTVGYEQLYVNSYYYGLMPMRLGLYDMNDVELKSEVFSVQKYLDDHQPWSSENMFIDLPQSLEDGEYKLKIIASIDEGENYDYPMLDYSGKEAYVKVVVRGDTAYLKDCFLHNTYGVETFDVPRGIRVNDCFDVDVDVSYKVDYLPSEEHEDGPIGNVYLSLMKDGVEVASSPMCEVMVPTHEARTYRMQLTAPSEPGRYDLVLNDESGTHMTDMIDWFYHTGEVIMPVYILPTCSELYEDFETMTANNSTSDKNVQGRFTTWSFNKSGVRAPGEGKCNGTNAVMMKKPSYFYTAQPLAQNFFLAQAVFFNPMSSESKYRLTYSLDDGATWETANAFDGEDAVTVDGKSQTLATWLLNLTSDQPAIFRITMFGGGSSATYVDDFTLYYTESGVPGDVNGDGEVNIADINAIINIILSGNISTDAADVNGDGEVNIADVNTVVDVIQR